MGDDNRSVLQVQGLEEQLVQLNRIGIALSSERNLNKLLDMILHQTRRFTGAEGGSLYIIERKGLKFILAQNDALEIKEDARSAPASPFRDQWVDLTGNSLAGYVALTGQVVNLEDAYHIPADRHYHFNPEFDKKYNYRTRSMLVVPMMMLDNHILGVLQLINARDSKGQITTFDPKYEELAMSLASQAAVAIRNVRLTEELKQAHFDLILRLSMAAECKDEDTADHLRRMAHYSVILGEEMGFSPEQADLLRYAALMHDIGKLAIPEAILKKAGKLTPEEYEQIKLHTVYGARILGASEIPVLVMSATIALTHHEKHDGTGYPRGLKGEQIPMEGRITALADVVDALVSARCYRGAMSLDECLARIREGRGTHFHPDIVDAFFRRLNDIMTFQQCLSAG